MFTTLSFFYFLFFEFQAEMIFPIGRSLIQVQPGKNTEIENKEKNQLGKTFSFDETKENDLSDEKEGRMGKPIETILRLFWEIFLNFRCARETRVIIFVETLRSDFLPVFRRTIGRGEDREFGN